MSYKEELMKVNEKGKPSAGSKMAKPDNYDDSLNKGYKGNVQTEFEAKDRPKAAYNACSKQIGRDAKDADTTERTPHNTGCPCCS